jgi:hypothetical protein
MDFKQCAAVVAFEPPPDVTSYIQVTVVQQALLVFDTGLW